MRRTRYTAALLLTVSFLGWSVPALAKETIGVVDNSQGAATITREGKVFAADRGTKLLVGDTLSTGSDGSMGLILRDNSTLSLGPDSNLVIRKFLFSPGEEKLGLMARLSRGTMAYLSGLIGKLAPESVRIETPTSTIGIRGTRFVMKAGDPVSR